MKTIFSRLDKRILLLTLFFSLLLLVIVKHGYNDSRTYNIVIFIAVFVCFLLSSIWLKFFKIEKLLELIKRIVLANKFLVIFLSGYFVLFVVLAYKRHLNLDTAVLDLSLEQQVLWNTAHGRWFQSGLETANYLGDHFSLITLPVSLIYAVFPHVLTMFILQTAVVVIAGYGINRLAELFTKNKFISRLFMLCFLFYTAISGLLLFDYHPNVFALPLLIWAIYFYFRKKSKLSFLLFFLATLCKEEIGVFVAMFGLLIAIKYRDKKGWLLFIYGIVYSLLALLVFIPYFRAGPSDTWQRYAWLGSTLSEVINTLITKPGYVLEKLIGWTRLIYLLKLSLPVIFLFIFALPESLIILPSLLINLLTDFPFQISAGYQYDIPITVGIFFASIVGWQSLNNKIALLKSKLDYKFLLLIFLAVNLGLFFTHPFITTLFRPMKRYQDYLLLQDLQKKIPEDFIISAANMPGGQFGNFEHLQLFDPGVFSYQEIPDIVIVDKLINFDNNAQTKVDQLKQSNFETTLENDTLLILLNKDKKLN